uniref:DNA polymerase n=1 Tax=Moniliophthora roreri TaxID=221103 RepID=A0A0W0G3I5_MONRR
MPIQKLADRIILNHPKGSSAEILFYGATVISWKAGDKRHPEPSERLFVSSKAALDGSKPVRGGIPVVFPCFGAPTHPDHKDLSQHGFARSETWKWDSEVMDNDAGVSIKLTLEPSPKVAGLYKKPFRLGYVVTLAEHQLSTDLHVTNTSTSESYPPDAFEFQALFHNYVGGPSQDLFVTPVQGLEYKDKTDASFQGLKKETRAGVDVKKFTDSVYANAPQSYEVTWPGGGLAIKSKNLKDVVIWNPQAETGSKMADMEDGGWDKFVCVEPGYVQGFAQVQINQIDHYLAPPGPLDNSSLPLVPVLRIYGPSSDDRKVCLHVHQVYPYFYVEYTGSLVAPEVKKYASRLKRSINHAVALSFRRNPQSTKSQYIRSIILVKGIHFYGFHCSYSPFLKIMVVDPALVSRIVTILQSGTVMGTRFRTYENHLSFILQFLCDFGLYGCGWIDLGQIMERGREDEAEAEDESSPTTRFPPSPHFRQSRMSLELDVIAPQILNRHEFTARNIHHKLEVPAPPLSDEPFVPGVRELWEDERKRRAARGFDPSPEMPMDPSDSARGTGGTWVAEARWWDEIRKRIERERERPVNFDTGEKNERRWEGAVMSTFESIEALWEEEMKTWRPIRSSTSSDSAETNLNEVGILKDEIEEDAGVDVDASFLASHDHDDDPTARPPNWGDIEYDEMEEEQDLDDNDDHYEHDEMELEEESTRPSPEPVVEIDPENVFIGEDPSDSSGLFGRQGDITSIQPSATADDIEGADEVVVTGDDLLVPAETLLDNEDLRQRPNAGALVNDGDRIPNLKRRRLDATAGLTYHTQLPVAVTPRPHEEPDTPKNRVQLVKKTAAFRSFYRVTPSFNGYVYSLPPPSPLSLQKTLVDYGLPDKLYRSPYYSDGRDVPTGPREYAGLTFELKGGDSLANVEEWIQESTGMQYDENEPENPPVLSATSYDGWEFAGLPPSVKQVKKWLLSADGARNDSKKSDFRSQIKGPTQHNIYGLQSTPIIANTEGGREGQNMSVLSLEVFAPSSSGRTPDPNEDEIFAAFYIFQESDFGDPVSGTIIVHCDKDYGGHTKDSEVDFVDNELDLINLVVDKVVDLEPDVITGWEVQNASWGYLAARGRSFGLQIDILISRAPPRAVASSEQWDTRHTTTFHVAGRHVFNLWRVMRSELSLNTYSFENVVFHVLGRRTPKFSSRTLSTWCKSTASYHNFLLLKYFRGRAAMNLEILNQSEVLTKTAEFARVFGIDFYSVISRGSQFKVESFMARIAKPESFVLLSPSKKDVGKQNAAECIPLILEPQSAFYSSPLVVLDFQSLYPSIMVSRNYCYSTCLGRVVDFQGKNKFGVVDELPRIPGLLGKLREHITGTPVIPEREENFVTALSVSPNGLIFVKSHVRQGLLPRMLTELLDTRVMVKTAMKGVKSDKILTRILNARQLGLKYIANVTYGYTSASFSGRMPAVEIADAIVQSGRETLEKAIRLIHQTTKWNAEVVYGDTDSLFIYLPGRTKEQAFLVGQEIADTITRENPKPMILKFEKVYHPCVLLAKKRYVGWKFERPGDTPSFDAKGIETVRRDGIRAARIMTEKCLKILFRTQDLSEIKEYCCETWTKLLKGKLPVQDFMFAKEVRLGTYSDDVPPPPGVAVAARKMLLDPNDELQYGDRIPYVIARGLPGTRLVDRAMDPLDFLENSHMTLDAPYYITRVLIPPLERIFDLIGADVRQWYNEMPRPKGLEVVSPSKGDPMGVVISDRLNIYEHFDAAHCLLCGDYTRQGICGDCRDDTQVSGAGLLSNIRHAEVQLVNTHRICGTCCGLSPAEPVSCVSLDCPWLFSRKRADDKAGLINDLVQQLRTIEVTSGTYSDKNETSSPKD